MHHPSEFLLACRLRSSSTQTDSPWPPTPRPHPQDFFNKYLHPGSGARRKLSVHILGKEHQGEAAAAPPAGVEVFEDIEALKAGLQLYPAAVGNPAK